MRITIMLIFTGIMFLVPNKLIAAEGTIIILASEDAGVDTSNISISAETSCLLIDSISLKKSDIENALNAPPVAINTIGSSIESDRKHRRVDPASGVFYWVGRKDKDTVCEFDKARLIIPQLGVSWGSVDAKLQNNAYTFQGGNYWRWPKEAADILNNRWSGNAIPWIKSSAEVHIWYHTAKPPDMDEQKIARWFGGFKIRKDTAAKVWPPTVYFLVDQLFSRSSFLSRLMDIVSVALTRLEGSGSVSGANSRGRFLIELLTIPADALNSTVSVRLPYSEAKIRWIEGASDPGDAELQGQQASIRIKDGEWVDVKVAGGCQLKEKVGGSGVVVADRIPGLVFLRKDTALSDSIDAVPDNNRVRIHCELMGKTVSASSYVPLTELGRGKFTTWSMECVFGPQCGSVTIKIIDGTCELWPCSDWSTEWRGDPSCSAVPNPRGNATHIQCRPPASSDLLESCKNLLANEQRWRIVGPTLGMPLCQSLASP